jgi:hypothetical protein
MPCGGGMPGIPNGGGIPVSSNQHKPKYPKYD